MAIMLDERERIFFGAGIDVHVIERGNDGIEQTNRMQIDQGQAVEIERLIGTRHRRRRPALVLHGEILLGGLFGNLIDRSRLMQHAEKGVRVGQNGRVGRHVRVASIFEAEPKARALRERRCPRWPGPRGSIRLARVRSRGRGASCGLTVERTTFSRLCAMRSRICSARLEAGFLKAANAARGPRTFRRECRPALRSRETRRARSAGGRAIPGPSRPIYRAQASAAAPIGAGAPRRPEKVVIADRFRELVAAAFRTRFPSSTSTSVARRPGAATSSGISPPATASPMARVCSDHSACCDSRSFNSNCLTGPSGPERSKARRNQPCAACFSLVEAFFKDQGVSADQHIRIVAAFGDRRVDEIAQAALTRGLGEMGRLNQRRGAEFGCFFDESRERLGKRLPIAGFERNGDFEIEVALRSGAAEFARPPQSPL